MTTRSSPNSNAELIITLTGNVLNNPFTYTSSSESAARIECLCVVSNSAISISAGTSYTVATCTRYIISGMPTSIGVKINANNGQYMACYFPGFTVGSWGNGWTMYGNFYR
jgi:hypothetical protein